MHDPTQALWDADLCLRAAAFAAEAHNGQPMLGIDAPYLLHVASVAMETGRAIAEAGGHPDADLAMVCAWLHDTVEDTGVTEQGVRTAFGDPVARGVMALTKDPGLTKREAMLDSIERLRREPPAVRMVKLADRVVNLQKPPASWSLSKRSRYADEAAVILGGLGDADPGLARRLRAATERYRAEHCSA